MESIEESGEQKMRLTSLEYVFHKYLKYQNGNLKNGEGLRYAEE